MADSIFISKHLLEKRFYNFLEHIQVSRIHKMNLSFLSFCHFSYMSTAEIGIYSTSPCSQLQGLPFSLPRSLTLSLARESRIAWHFKNHGGIFVVKGKWFILSLLIALQSIECLLLWLPYVSLKALLYLRVWTREVHNRGPQRFCFAFFLLPGANGTLH